MKCYGSCEIAKQAVFASQLVLAVAVFSAGIWTQVAKADPPSNLSDRLHNFATPSHTGIQSRAQAIQQLASELASQANRLTGPVPIQMRGTISGANLAKLSPAFRRQQGALLSNVPMMKQFKVTQRTGNNGSADNRISTEIVGSISQAKPPVLIDGPLQHVRQRLTDLKSKNSTKPLTILQISSTPRASDVFARTIRSGLQSDYGDAGRGMIAPAMGRSQMDVDQVQLTKSGRWRVEMGKMRSKAAIGLSGMRLISRSSLSSMTFASQNGPFDWIGATIATGPSQGVFTLSVGDVDQEFDAYSASPGARLFKMPVQGVTATLRPGGGAQTALLGWTSGRTAGGVSYVDFDMPTLLSEQGDLKLLINDIRAMSADLVVFESNLEFDNQQSAKSFADMVKQIMAATDQADHMILESSRPSDLPPSRACVTVGVRQSAVGPINTSTNLSFSRAKKLGITSLPHWKWQPQLKNICDVRRKASKRPDAAIKDIETADYARLRAAAFVRWLTQAPKTGAALALR